jgi:pilus assembly protein TadC
MTVLPCLGPLTVPFLFAAAAVLTAPISTGGASVRLSRAELLAGLAASQPGGISPTTSRRRSAAGGRSVTRFRFAGTAAGVALGVVVGGPVGLLVGCVVAVVGVRVLTRLEPAAARRARELRRDELPEVLSLLAAALSAGLPLSGALAAVASATGGALAPDLARVGELSSLGAGPAAAWADCATDPVLSPVARAAIRSADSGSALAAAFRQLAAELRADAELRAEEAARRAGALATAPLGLCFLPAFLCLGVVPVVIGIAQQVLP